jgi:hypothetical protein
MLINNSNEFRPACGEDTGLDSLTGRFKRNCRTSCNPLETKIGPLQQLVINHRQQQPQQQRKFWWVSVSPKAGNSMECYENVSVEFLLSTPHFLFLFFGKCKILWRTNEQCWLGARPKVTVVETVELERADDLPAEIQKVNTRGTGCCGRWRCRCVKTLGVLFI